MVQAFLGNVWRDFRLLTSALATVARKSLSGKFTSKNYFPIGHFMLPLLMLTLEVYNLSILDKYLGHVLVKFDQNRMGRDIYKICAFLTKLVYIF